MTEFIVNIFKGGGTGRDGRRTSLQALGAAGGLRASLKDLFKKSLHAACIMVTDEESGQKAWQLRDCCQRIDRHYQWRLCGSD